MTESSHPPDKGERFTRLLTQHQRHLHAFLYSVTQDRQAADDLLQDVGSILWRKFSSFEEGTNFKSWAFRIARLEVMNWRRKQRKLPLPLDDETLTSLIEISAELAESQDERRDALDVCLEKMSDKQQELLRRFYHLGESAAEIAAHRNRTPRAIYKALGRLHEALTKCVRERLTLEGINS